MHTYRYIENVKPSICTECRQEIPAGQMAWYDDDAFETYCEKCGYEIVEEYDLLSPRSSASVSPSM